MRNSLSCAAALCAAVAVVIPAPAYAADGALEINQDCVAAGCFSGDPAGFPVLITQPGRYVLTSNLLVTGSPATTVGILIQASPVDLDLGGFTIDGGGTCTGNPASACSGTLASRGIHVPGSNRLVKIHNGTVRGFNDAGVSMSAVQDGTLLEDLTVTETAVDGINATGASNASIRLHRVALTRNRFVGIFHTASGRLIVDESVFSNNGDRGADIGTRAVFVNSTFSFNGGFGVFCSGLCALGQSAFLDNNTASTDNEFSIVTLRDMGGNVCEDGTCP